MARCSKCGKKLWLGGYEWDNKDYCSKCYDSLFQRVPYVFKSAPVSSQSKSTKTTQSKTDYTQTKTNHTTIRKSSNTKMTSYSSSVGYDNDCSTSNNSSDSSLCAYYQNGCCKHGYNSAYNNISCDYSECFQNLCSNYKKR